VWKGIGHGGSDIDTLTAGGANVVLNGDGEGDTLIALQSATGSILDGGAGADILKTASAVTLIGGAGGDTFENTSSGYSLVSYLTSEGAVEITQSGNTFMASGGDAGGDTFTGKFTFRGSDYGDVFRFSSTPGVWGGGGDDDIIASGYQTNVYGEEGNDTIRVSGGIAYGGTGNDIITGTNTIYGEANDDHLYLLATNASGFGTVWNGATANGGTGENTIYGSIGDDTVFMNEGEDTFITWGGRMDFLYGVGSNDTVRIIHENVSSMDDIDVVQTGSNVQLDFDGGSIKFMGLSLSALSSIEFDFA